MVRSNEDLKSEAKGIAPEDQQIGAAAVRSILNERDVETLKGRVDTITRWSLIAAIVGGFGLPASALITTCCPRYEWQPLNPSEAGGTNAVLRVDKWRGEARLCQLDVKDAPSGPRLVVDCDR